MPSDLMRRGLVVALLLAVLAPTAEAKRPKLRCSAGVTLFAEGKLRLFGVHYRTSDEEGYQEYACVGRRARPLEVGGVGHDSGVGSGATPAYALGGSRWLGSFHITDGEAGGYGYFRLVDLRTRRGLAAPETSYSLVAPEFRVAEDGSLVTDTREVRVQAAGSRRSTLLSAPGVLATDLALAGNVVYWTEHPKGAPAVARSATLAGLPADGPEAHMLEPVRPRAIGGACVAHRGRTIAASRSVRVYERGGRRRACRIGGSGPVGLGAAGAPAPRIVKDRWLLTGAVVIDMRSRDTVTTVAGGIRRSTLLDDGTLAWIDDGGRVLVQRPAGDAPAELAPASPAPSALAASRKTVYWTADGVAHGVRAPG
jgi:hypothetical protein